MNITSAGVDHNDVCGLWALLLDTAELCAV